MNIDQHFLQKQIIVILAVILSLSAVSCGGKPKSIASPEIHAYQRIPTNDEPAPIIGEIEGSIEYSSKIPMDPIGSTQPISSDSLLAYWNAWFQRGDKIFERLKTGQKYDFVLDVSKFIRNKKTNTQVSREVIDILKEQITQDEARFIVRILFTGIDVNISNQTMEKELRVDLKKLSDSYLSVNELENWEKGVGTKEYLKKGSAGHISLEMSPKQEGCGAVTISIWDESGLQPLDHIIYEYAVGKVECPFYGELFSGLKLGVSISSLQPFSDADKADAAFHIFELPSNNVDQGSIVWFVNRKEYEVEQEGNKGVYAWQTLSSLNLYIQTDTQLPAILAEAKKLAQKEHSQPYEKVAKEFRRKLFTATNNNVASDALLSFRELVNNSEMTPMIQVRFSTTEGELRYLPFSLLTAKVTEPIFQQSFITLQPLPRERINRNKTCVFPWMFGLPDELSGFEAGSEFSEEIKNKLQKTAHDISGATKSQYAFVHTIDELKNYLQNQQKNDIKASDTNEIQRSEGIVLLAHHADGNFWFSNNLDRVIPEDFNRVFNQGSVAIIFACSVGGSGPLGNKIIDTLNNKNIDTMIVSLFDVPADFGANLAINFVSSVQEAYSQNQTPTIAKLYEEALSKTTKDFMETNARNFHDIGLEFIFLGDPRIQLCANQ